MNKELLNAVLRTDFKSFVIKVFNDVAAGSEYLDNWHIDVICDALMNMYDGENNRLIINIPPRYMKSIICSVALPAWLLGHNPKTNIICVSYNDELAEKFASDCRNIMQSDWYHELFPLTRLRQSRKAVSDFETTKGGGRMSTSIGGTLTGRGADWIIIDDPMKPADAMSETWRDKVNDWYGSTLYSRLNNKENGKIVLIMQRLHMDDLTGFLLDSDAKFRLVKLPVIATEDETWVVKSRAFGNVRTFTRTAGELLHPERENADTIEDLKNSLGSYAFAGQYQQDPTSTEGGIVKESWLKYFDINSIKGIDHWRIHGIYISWDTACKVGENNAYSACCMIAKVWSRDGYKYYLMGVERGKWEMPELAAIAKELYDQWRRDGGFPVKVLIEDKSSGTSLIQILQQERDTCGRRVFVEPIRPSGDKNSRMYAASVYIERGDLVFPDDNPEWWPEFKKELLGFPGTKFKDQADALSQCMNFAPLEDPNDFYKNYDWLA